MSVPDISALMYPWTSSSFGRGTRLWMPWVERNPVEAMREVSQVHTASEVLRISFIMCFPFKRDLLDMFNPAAKRVSHDDIARYLSELCFFPEVVL